MIYPLDIALYPTFGQLGLIQILWASSLRYAICFSDRNHLCKLVARPGSPNKQLNLDHPITVGLWAMNLRSYALLAVRSTRSFSEFYGSTFKDDISTSKDGINTAHNISSSSFIFTGLNHLSIILCPLEGCVEVTKDCEFLGQMRGGTVFGELAILYNCKRTATVKGTTYEISFD